MLSEENRRMLKYGMRAPLAPLLDTQIRECERLVKEGLMALAEEGYITTEFGRWLYEMEMQRITQCLLVQSQVKWHTSHDE